MSVGDFHPENGPGLMTVLFQTGEADETCLRKRRALLPVKENSPGSFSTSDKIVSRIESTCRA
jgi:hypothetical protein